MLSFIGKKGKRDFVRLTQDRVCLWYKAIIAGP